MAKIYVEDYDYIASTAKWGETFAEALSKVIKSSQASLGSHSGYKANMTTKGGEK